VAEEIGERFGEVAILEERGSSVLSAIVADQAALRSLLTLIWDTGGDLLSVTLDPGTFPADVAATATVTTPGAPPTNAGINVSGVQVVVSSDGTGRAPETRPSKRRGGPVSARWPGWNVGSWSDQPVERRAL
jgi:hypothetical protein